MKTEASRGSCCRILDYCHNILSLCKLQSLFWGKKMLERAKQRVNAPKEPQLVRKHQLHTKFSPHPRTSNSKVAASKCFSSTFCSKPFFQFFFRLAVKIYVSLQLIEQKALALHLLVRDSHCLLLQSPCPAAFSFAKLALSLVWQTLASRLWKVSLAKQP